MAMNDHDDPALAQDLDAFDASLIEREGPDALTSDRAIRLAQFHVEQKAARLAALQRAERDSDRVGFVLAAFRSQRDWSREQLADWLGVGIDDFSRLAGEVRPLAVTMTGEYLHEPINDLADRFNAHAERLYEAFVWGDA